MPLWCEWNCKALLYQMSRRLNQETNRKVPDISSNHLSFLNILFNISGQHKSSSIRARSAINLFSRRKAKNFPEIFKGWVIVSFPFLSSFTGIRSKTFTPVICYHFFLPYHRIHLCFMKDDRKIWRVRLENHLHQEFYWSYIYGRKYGSTSYVQDHRWHITVKFGLKEFLSSYQVNHYYPITLFAEL